MPDKTENQPRPSRRRRILKRLLLTAGALLVILALLVLLAPTIATSGFVTRRAASVAEDRIGRPVEISGVDFGWRTTLFIERVVIGPGDGENDVPMLVAEDVAVPLTLRDLLRDPPWNLEGIEAALLEFNAVRDSEGVWNFAKVQEALATDDEQDDETEPSAIPVSALSLDVARIDARVVDLQNDLTAGWQDGSVQALWSGGANPLTADLAGDLILNNAKLPWDARLKVADWISDARMLTTETTHVTLGSDGIMNPEQIYEGGIFLTAGMAPDTQYSARMVLPGGVLQEGLSELELPADINISGGEFDALVNYQFTALDGIWEADWDFSASEFETGRAGLAGTEYTFAGLSLRSDGTLKYNVAETTLENLMADFAESESISMTVALSNWNHSETPLPPQAALAANVQFGPLSRAAAQVMTGEPASLASGSASLDVNFRQQDAETLAARMQLSFVPEQLISTRPFVEPPAALPELPLDLSPFRIRTTIGGTYNMESGEFEASLEEWTQPLMTLSHFRLGGTAGETPAWNTSAAGEADLAALLEEARKYISTDTPEELSGRLNFDFAASSAEGTTIATEGSARIDDLRVAIVDNPMVYEDPSLSAEWDLSIAPEGPQVSIARLNINARPATLTLSGSAGEQLDLQATAQLALDEALAIAEQAGPLPADIDGKVNLEAAVSGNPESNLDFLFKATSEGALLVNKEGVARFEDAVALALNGNVAEDGESWQRASLNLEQLEFGNVLSGDGALSANLTDGETSGSLQITLNQSDFVGLIDPAVFAERGLELLMDGETSLKVSGAGSPEASDALRFTGELRTVSPTIAMAAGENVVELGDLTDVHDFELLISPEEPFDFVLNDSWSSEATYLGLPGGVELGGFNGRAQIRQQGSSISEVNIEEWQIAGGFLINETAELFLPEMVLSGRFMTDLEKTLFEANNTELQIQEVGTASTDSTFNWTTQEFTTKSNINFPDLRAASELVGLESLAAGELPDYAGGLQLTADLEGRIPEEFSPADLAPPVFGDIAASLSDFAVSLPETGTSLTGLNLSFVAGNPKDGDSFEFTTTATADSFVNPALQRKPLRDLALDASARVTRDGTLTWDLSQAAVENYQIDGRSTGTLEGLRDALASELTGPRRWLSNVTLTSDLRVQHELEGLTGFMPGLTAEGFTAVTASLISEPDSRTEFSALTDIQNTRVEMANRFLAEDIGGTWEVRKTLLLAPDARRPLSPPPGSFDVGRVVAGRAPWRMELNDATVTLQGAETGLRMDTVFRDFIGGAATMTATVQERESDPLLTGRFQVTGLDTRQLMAGAEPDADRQAEVNAVGDLRWRLRDVSGPRLLEDLAVTLQTTRIGSIAMLRLLQSMDPDEQNPGIQNAITAIRLGTPVGAEGTMNTSLVSLESELLLPFGFRVDLPIVDRQPVADLVEVYDLEEASQNGRTLRWMLTLLLSDTLGELEENLQTGGAP